MSRQDKIKMRHYRNFRLLDSRKAFLYKMIR